MKKYFGLALLVSCCALCVAANESKDSIIVQNNNYAEIGFVNPSMHKDNINNGDFKLLPRRDVNNRDTADAANQRSRLFFKPFMDGWSFGIRKEYMAQDAQWTLKQDKGSIVYAGKLQKKSNIILSNIAVKMSGNRAEVIFEAVFANKGSNNCQVDFFPQFTFLTADADDLKNKNIYSVDGLCLVMPRKYSQLIDKKSEEVVYNEKTVLDDMHRNSYWWRKVVGKKGKFIDFNGRERVIFSGNMIIPNEMGFVGLHGGDTLIWDFKGSSALKMAWADMNWSVQDKIASFTPVWKIELKAGETKTLKFRLITLKNMSRFDIVGKDSVISYGSAEDKRTGIKRMLKFELNTIKSSVSKSTSDVALKVELMEGSWNKNSIKASGTYNHGEIKPFVPYVVEIPLTGGRNTQFAPHSGYPLNFTWGGDAAFKSGTKKILVPR